MLINELFSSIDGEARRAGELATFIRTVGCNLRCKFCFGPDDAGDYPYVSLENGDRISLDQVKEGDHILTLDEDRNNVVVTTVAGVSTRVSNDYDRILFGSKCLEAGEEVEEDITSLVVTPEHPFWVEGEGWVEAGKLKVGDPCIKVRPLLYKSLIDYNYQVLDHTKSVRGQCKEKTFINLSCAPYNTFLVDDIYVHNCDSRYTWGHEDTNKEMSVDEIVEECKRLGNHNVTFTGGEPLIQKDADELILRLAREGFDVSIETDGAVDFTARPWFKPDDEIEYGSILSRIWVCADYKCLASGMTDKMLGWDKFARLRSNDVLKFVVGSQKDLELACEVITYIRSHGCDCYVYLSPVFGDIEPAEIVAFMQEHKLQGKIRAQLQLHKLIWNPDERQR